MHTYSTRTKFGQSEYFDSLPFRAIGKMSPYGWNLQD